jgi:hypothetical protein
MDEEELRCEAAADDGLLGELEVLGVERCRVHAQTLRAAVRRHALNSARGMALATVSELALWLNISESAATTVLEVGLGLAELPGAFEAVECGLLTPEQCATLVRQLRPLDELPLRLQVWRRLQQRLVADAERGAVLPPARLTELLRRWVIAADTDAAAARRRRAEADRCVGYERGDDGLYDLFARGVRAADAQAILQRIRAASQPVGADDDRTADQRRCDAFVDLLLGRDPLGEHRGCEHGCACRPGSAAPCGAKVVVLVPLRGALGTSDEPAELAGHGPIEPDLLRDLLLAGPELRPVWVDDDGVPVAQSSHTYRVRAGDETHLRAQLLRLADLPPPPPQPNHPLDHARPGETSRSAHPPDAPGPYRPPAGVGRLVQARAPRCEFPACGCRSNLCDLEHDIAHPDGPTCSCNLGPCCRRHHRVKQLGWTKTRVDRAAVRWTDPSGRVWFSPSQHSPPAPAVRPLPPLRGRDWRDELDPGELEDLLEHLGLAPVDDHVPDDVEPDDTDRIGDALRESRTQWTLDLDDPYICLEPISPGE